MQYETLLVIVQPTSTTVLDPLPTGVNLTLTVNGGLPGPAGSDAPISDETYDPGDLTVYFRNGLV